MASQPVQGATDTVIPQIDFSVIGVLYRDQGALTPPGDFTPNPLPSGTPFTFTIANKTVDKNGKTQPITLQAVPGDAAAPFFVYFEWGSGDSDLCDLTNGEQPNIYLTIMNNDGRWNDPKWGSIGPEGSPTYGWLIEQKGGGTL